MQATQAQPPAPPAVSTMQVDTPTPPPDDMTAAVRRARAELAGAITLLTQVLSAVAEGDPPPLDKPVPANGQTLTETEKKEYEEAIRKRNAQVLSLRDRRSLAPVLARFDSLRKAVDAAVGLRKQRVDSAQREEDEISAEEKQQLVERRAQLVDDVTAKNKKIKILIDHLRELHRDIVPLLAPYKKHHSAQNRKS